MNSKKQNTLIHAWSMLVKNLSTYGLLSVTIVLSFALMFSVFVVVDSINYNKYKEILSQSPHLAQLSQSMDTNKSKSPQEHYAPLIKHLDKLSNTEYYYYGETPFRAFLPNVHHEQNAYWNAFSHAIFVPNYIWGFWFYQEGQVIFNGKSHLELKADEVVIPETMLKAMEAEGKGIGHGLTVLFKREDGTMSGGTYKIAGSYVLRFLKYDPRDPSNERFIRDSTRIFLPFSAIEEHQVEISEVGMLIHSPHQASINQVKNKYSYAGANYYHEYKSAMSEKRDAVLMKGIICAATYIILSINLLGAFANALNKRSFEIGVKRAIGASPWQVTTQFLIEGTTVISINILLASIVSLIPLLAYKLYMVMNKGVVWTIYLSSYSLAVYLINCVIICIVASLYFAYRSSKIEVITLIKGS